MHCPIRSHRALGSGVALLVWRLGAPLGAAAAAAGAQLARSASMRSVSGDFGALPRPDLGAFIPAGAPVTVLASASSSARPSWLGVTAMIPYRSVQEERLLIQPFNTVNMARKSCPSPCVGNMKYVQNTAVFM